MICRLLNEVKIDFQYIEMSKNNKILSLFLSSPTFLGVIGSLCEVVETPRRFLRFTIETACIYGWEMLSLCFVEPLVGQTFCKPVVQFWQSKYRSKVNYKPYRHRLKTLEWLRTETPD